jgi:hypothetical protein
LIEHPTRPGAATGKDGFIRALLALRASFPGLTLVVDDVRAAGADQVLARVHVDSAGLDHPVPASVGPWGPVDVWRIANGQLVERWGSLDPLAAAPGGQASIAVDALGPGRRRVTVTRITVEPKATLPVDNGQAIRVFAVDVGTLTVDVGGRFGGMVAVARGSAKPAVTGPGESIAAGVGDHVVTAPEAHYTLVNAGSTPVIALVIIVSNTLGGEWPQNRAAAATSWTVAAMPEALGGALPSPVGISAQVLAAGVEIEVPAEPILTLGWMVLASDMTLMLPTGNGAVARIVAGGGTPFVVYVVEVVPGAAATPASGR